MLHDLSDTDGPIRSSRIQWCVGPDWQDQLKTILKKDSYLPPPTIMIQLTPEGRSVTQEAKRLYHEVEAVGKPAYDEAIADYESRTTEQWAEILRGRAGRPPRVLLVTSRFTTVLQHATRDAAEAFEHLGWETRLLIEPSAYQRLTTWCVEQVLSEFRPDLVFVIDHLRSGCRADTRNNCRLCVGSKMI